MFTDAANAKPSVVQVYFKRFHIELFKHAARAARAHHCRKQALNEAALRQKNREESYKDKVGHHA